MLVSGPGWKPFRARIAPDPANLAWSRLSVRLLAADPVVLTPVTVRAVRAPPGRDLAIGPGVGAAEAPVEGVAASLAPAEAGELAAMAATVPGVLRTGEGFSVLGLDPSHNRATLNGMEFAGASLPRDLAARTRVATTAYDPARGGFSGAEVAVEVAPGSAFTLGRGSLSAGASAFGGDAAQANDFRASVGRDGEISPERLYYSAGAQVSRQLRDASSIERARADALAGAGVSPAAGAELERVLSSLGLPPGAGGGTAATDEMVLMARVDPSGSGSAIRQRRRCGSSIPAATQEHQHARSATTC